jgi:hypothetical protein
VTLFKVLLDETHVRSTPEKTICAVHDAIGLLVDEVLQEFSEDLRECFMGKIESHPKRVTIVRQKTESTGWPTADISSENNTKKTRYEALVKARKECRVCSGVSNASDIDDGKFDCDEVGALSLWQGNLDAELMVVAQDFGDVRWFLEAEGRPTSTSTTNTTLVHLLRSAGLNIDLANRTTAKGLLFFTNAVLCMKQGGARGSQASVRPEWLRNCGTRFLRPTI